MTLPFASKKSVAVAAAAVVMSCTLTACGSDSETTAGGGLSTAATAQGAANEAGENTVAEEPSAEGGESKASESKPTTSAEKKNNGGEKKDEGRQEDQAIPTLINPLEDGLESPEFEPLAGGREGTEAERKEMEEVVTKISNPESFAKWTRVILDNSCADVREPAMEQFESQGLTLEMVEQQEAQGGAFDIPRSEITVSDVRVDGDRASATVHSKSNAGENESVQLFAKEDGKWKVCKN